MPTYEYGCSCGEVVEVVRRIERRHDGVVCPSCRSRMELRVSAFFYKQKMPVAVEQGLGSVTPGDIGSAKVQPGFAMDYSGDEQRVGVHLGSESRDRGDYEEVTRFHERGEIVTKHYKDGNTGVEVRG